MSSPPTTLGQYQIIREIARSNDIVYEAYDPLMNRRVAVKELSMPTGATAQQKDERIARFKREAQAAGTLNHPNIMTVYSFAEDQGRTFMAMEYLDGTTLRAELDAKGSLPIARAVEIICDILSGLDHAHSKGVIHRDIKPDNVQILSNGQIKITDFGIARLTFQPNLTMDGQVFGTPSYMSPEQVVGREIDARSDLFSVGVLLYEMLSGQKPFPGDSVVTITYGIMNNLPSQPQNISYPLWQVISKALDKSPQLRFASAMDMIDALRAAVQPNGQLMPDPVMPQSQIGFAPPQVSPNSAPYNPYGNQPALAPPVVGNPYMAPQVPVNQPPMTYPYNPYQQNQPMTAPYQPGPVQPVGMPPPNALPQFYPPAPRQPLFKPETVNFTKQLLIFFLLIGTLFWLVYEGVIFLAGQFERADAERRDSRVKSSIAAMDPSLPVDDRISKLESASQKLSSGNEKNVANQNLAVLYEEQAQGYMRSGDFVHAEDAINKAVTLDPHNPAIFSSLAQLYQMQAEKAADPDTAAELWRKCGEAFSTAASQQTDAATRDKWKEYAATAYYRRGISLDSAGDRSGAREALNDARELVPSGSSLLNDIENYLSKLRS